MRSASDLNTRKDNNRSGMYRIPPIQKHPIGRGCLKVRHVICPSGASQRVMIHSSFGPQLGHVQCCQISPEWHKVHRQCTRGHHMTCKIIKKNGQNLVERKPWPLLVSSRQRNILYFYCYDHYYCFRCKCIERPRFRFFFLSAFDISFKLKLTADLMKSTRPTMNANQ